MAQGGHLKHDLPKILDAIRAEHRGAEITLLPAIGDVDAILDAISDWLVRRSRTLMRYSPEAG